MLFFTDTDSHLSGSATKGKAKEVAKKTGVRQTTLFGLPPVAEPETEKSGPGRKKGKGKSKESTPGSTQDNDPDSGTSESVVPMDTDNAGALETQSVNETQVASSTQVDGDAPLEEKAQVEVSCSFHRSW